METFFYLVASHPEILFVERVVLQPPNPEISGQILYLIQFSRADYFKQVSAAQCAQDRQKTIDSKLEQKMVVELRSPRCPLEDWSTLKSAPSEQAKWCNPTAVKRLVDPRQKQALIQACRQSGRFQCSPASCWMGPTQASAVGCETFCREHQREWLTIVLTSLHHSIYFLDAIEAPSVKTPPLPGMGVKLTAPEVELSIAQWDSKTDSFTPRIVFRGNDPKGWTVGQAYDGFFFPSYPNAVPLLRRLPPYLTQSEKQVRVLTTAQLIDYLMGEQLPPVQLQLGIRAQFQLPLDNPAVKFVDENATVAVWFLERAQGQLYGDVDLKPADESNLNAYLTIDSKTVFGQTSHRYVQPGPLTQSCTPQTLQTKQPPRLVQTVVFRQWVGTRILCFPRDEAIRKLHEMAALPAQAECTMVQLTQKLTCQYQFYPLPISATWASKEYHTPYVVESTFKWLEGLLNSWAYASVDKPNDQGTYEFRLIPLGRVQVQGRRTLESGPNYVPYETPTWIWVYDLDVTPPSRLVAALPALPGAKSAVLPLPKTQTSRGSFRGVEDVIRNMPISNRCTGDTVRTIPFLRKMVEQGILANVCIVGSGKGVVMYEPGSTEGPAAGKGSLVIDFDLAREVGECKFPTAIVPLTLRFVTGGGHANLMIIDKISKTFERFDPHGITGFDDRFFEKLVREDVYKFLPAGYKYEDSYASCPVIGPQSRMDPGAGQRCPQGGYCVIFQPCTDSCVHEIRILPAVRSSIIWSEK